MYQHYFKESDNETPPEDNGRAKHRSKKYPRLVRRVQLKDFPTNFEADIPKESERFF